jgi:hypothetical protein
VDQQPRAALVDPLDAFEDVLFGAGGQTLEPAQLTLLRGSPQLLQRADTELIVQEFHGSRPDTADAQHVEQPPRDLGAKPVVVLEVAGVRELRELCREGWTGPGDLRRVAAAVSGGDILWPALDGIRHPSVGDRLVDDLTEDLEHVADLVEDARQLAVADDLVAGARNTARSGHETAL